MVSIFLNPDENKLISVSEKDNKEDLISWKIPNVLFPLIVIVFSLIAYILFIPGEKQSCKEFFNLLLNGSVPMVAFNRMSSIINYFSKIEFNDAKKLGINLKNLKMKILFYLIVLILAIIVLYCYQVINRPFEISCLTFLQLLFSGLLVWFAADVTKISFLLQETLLTNTYELSFRKAQQSITETPENNDIQF